ncbi:MAG: DUF4982 domain-containing protein [Prevotellaceae bacterium]|nr:DUF4982 domain-containing protein [Candidatus Minthosoma caballi]
MSIGKLRKISFAAITLSCSLAVMAQRQEVTLSQGWKFSRGEGLDAAAPAQTNYDDRKWLSVSVPHDWAISGPFDKEIDKQTVAIEQNGEKEATEKTGRSGSLPWIGSGWYRTTVDINPDTERAILNFDGAMAEPDVYVNGQKAGEWKYGYSAFNIDITPYLSKSSAKQTIAVHLQNVEESSRWYPGAGLYRPVKLITTKKTAIEEWSIEANTIALNQGTPVVEFKASVVGADDKPLVVEYKIAVSSIAERKIYNEVKDGKSVSTSAFAGVKLWTPEIPAMYDLTVSLYELKDGKPGELIDQQTKKIGFRTVKCSAEGGFQLNGETRKIKGVCLHHDLGMLGAAVNKAALVRQVELLKSMGCDAIRTAHNMPSQLQMDVCDSLGMMVMAESFDMWIYKKCKNGYARFFKEWSDRDIENLVRANRLHPSIVMWSVGNEIPEQGSAEGARILRHLQDVVHKYDNTRPVTNGMDKIEAAMKSGFAQVAEVPGMNYRTHLYNKALNGLGHGYILGSETASTVSSRGVYKFPVVRADGKAYNDGQCSSYDTEACWWSNIPEEDWMLQDDNDWVIGEFVWTGFDYLGEPTPYDEYWPSRSSYFGIFDLAGLPKDRYYLYRSKWNKENKTIHLLPHWTFPGREGEVTPVYCYTNYPTAELFVNGKSQGKISKRTEVKSGAGKDGKISDINDPALDRYRLRWNNVKYEPGEIKVVVYDADGKEAGTETVKTAGAPHGIKVSGDLGNDIKTLSADGNDMTFITVSIVDKDGNLVPDADNLINVSVKGAAEFKGMCNGDATSTEVFTQPSMKAFHGQLVVGIQSNGKGGKTIVDIKGKGLKSGASVQMEVK